MAITQEQTWGSVANNVALVLMSRVFQVLGIPLGLGLMGWFALTVNSLQINVEHVNTLVGERTADRYTATDARHDFATIAVQMDDITRRIGVLETYDLRGEQPLLTPRIRVRPTAPPPGAAIH